MADTINGRRAKGGAHVRTCRTVKCVHVASVEFVCVCARQKIGITKPDVKAEEERGFEEGHVRCVL